MPNGDPGPVVPKREESREEIISSLESFHDDDQQPDRRKSGSAAALLDGSPVQKRKGGRKPLYATTEERKQRNRRAQAAFRERRSEHIKTLELEKKDMQEDVKRLEETQQKTKDECLMLRYKNALLERLLIEKNIDFESEIQQKGLSYSPAEVPRGPSQLPMHRSALRPTQRRPQPLNTNSPNVRQASSNIAGNLPRASESPVIPPTLSSFTFSPVSYTQQTTPQLTSSNTSYMGTMDPSVQESISSAMSSPVHTRRPSVHGQWGGMGIGSADPSIVPYAVDASTPVAGQVGSPVLQEQFQRSSVLSQQQQIAMLRQGQFRLQQQNIGPILDQGGTAASHSAMAQPRQGQQTPVGLNHAFNVPHGGDFAAAFASLESEQDPFGIDRSMQYPTQFDDFSGAAGSAIVGDGAAEDPRQQ